MELRTPPGKTDSGGDGATTDSAGRYYITSHLGHLPASGEKTHIEGYEVTITSVDSRKILRLHFRRIVPETPGQPGDEGY